MEALATLLDNPPTTQAEKRERILSFEEKLSKVPGAWFGDTDNLPLIHSFADGIYVREMLLPAGTIVVGKIHKHSHPNFILTGDVTVYTEDGGVERLQAPQSIISPAGTKRVVYAHENTVWITVHKTDETDTDKVVDLLTCKTYEDFDRYIESEGSL